MNPGAILSLIVSLYEQVIALTNENAELKQKLSEVVSPGTGSM